ncbi:hypothetical protein P3T27_005688 [Kitasatospora sp. MAA19]|uniref:hypothetical protein n=1 Tax=Kitasatospora sp. MAA19 TaxID=3035090 RepID=UPI002473D8E1|nr:hypothetical protein [Kitasatospora sp. MAA19]MDH6708942.1 hypothetical protein [Kitasatospora sp. MAA19]
MIGTDLLDPDDPGPDGVEGEQELRILLHEAVPVLAEPEDRMAQIRARAARTRRRRRAGGLGAGLTAGLVAAALAAAPAIAPGPERAAAGGTAPAATAPEPTAAGGPSVEAETHSTPIRFSRFPIVMVEVPNGWYSQSAVSSDSRVAFGYLATGPIEPTPSCPPTAGSCPPADRLPVDGAVLTLRVGDDPGIIQKLTNTQAGLANTPLDKDCSLRGGNSELVGHRIVIQSGAPLMIQLTACLRGPSGRTLQQVQGVLDSIRSNPGGTSSPSPGRG